MFRALLLTIVAASALTVSPQALAGGWTSMGGEIVGDTMNPWFFRKMTAAKRIVDYCIEVDEANFGFNKRQLYFQVEGALRFWSDELSAGIEPGNPEHLRFYLGTEAFAYREQCTDETPLRFQFGSLTPEQMAKFDELHWNPRQHVGMAVRTDYDVATMQGKGFIYISPARGPLAMTGSDILEDPWVDGRLSYVLRHELGHVFGLQHRGTNSELMGAAFPEHIVDRGTTWYGSVAGVFRTQFGKVLSSICFSDTMRPFLRDFFGTPAGHRCIGMVVNRGSVEVLTGADYDDDLTPVGKANFDATPIERPEPVIRLWLPDGQTVFTDVPSFFGRILNGPMIKHTQVTGTYVNPTTGLERPVHIQISPERLQVGGIMDGRIIMDANWER